MAKSEVLITNGSNVGQRIVSEQGEIVLWYTPTEAEAFSQSMHDAAMTVLAREGIKGDAVMRDIHVTLPTIRIGITALGAG